MTDGYSRKQRLITIGLAMAVSVWVHIIGFAIWQYSDPMPAVPSMPPPLVMEIEWPEPTEALAEEPPPLPDEVTTVKNEAKTESESSKADKKAGEDQRTNDESDKENVAHEPVKPDIINEKTTNETDAADKTTIGTGDMTSRTGDFSALPPDEEIISLESKAPEYLSYLGQIKSAINHHWIFPPAARDTRTTGRLSAVFTLDNSGQLIRILVEESSGHPILDHAAMEAVRGAAPFPPFPDHIQLARLNIRANFDYRIKYIRVK